MRIPEAFHMTKEFWKNSDQNSFGLASWPTNSSRLIFLENDKEFCVIIHQFQKNSKVIYFFLKENFIFI